MRRRRRHATHVAKRDNLRRRLLQVEIEDVELLLFRRLLLSLFELSVGQEESGSESLGSLERDADRVRTRPDPLKVRITPRRPGRGVRGS